jgi:hypothetical protein
VRFEGVLVSRFRDSESPSPGGTRSRRDRRRAHRSWNVLVGGVVGGRGADRLRSVGGARRPHARAPVAKRPGPRTL